MQVLKNLVSSRKIFSKLQELAVQTQQFSVSSQTSLLQIVIRSWKQKSQKIKLVLISKLSTYQEVGFVSILNEIFANILYFSSWNFLVRRNYFYREDIYTVGSTVWVISFPIQDRFFVVIHWIKKYIIFFKIRIFY